MKLIKLVSNTFCILVLASCSNEKQAAELLNSVAHSFDLSVTTQSSLPSDLSSGECRNDILGGGLATLSGYISNNILRGTLNTSFQLDSKCSGTNCQRFECNVAVEYSLSANNSKLLDGGLVTSCDGFSCKLKGKDIKCEDLKKELKINTCSTTDVF